MRKLDKEEFETAAGLIDRHSCGAIYPLSVAERFQAGNMFAGEGSLLVWHDCGFAFLYGKCGREFLDEVYDTFLAPGSVNKRRFVLFADNERLTEYFGGRERLALERRLFFEYDRSTAEEVPLREGFELREIDRGNIGLINGRITPAFSWTDSEAFLEKGKGFCVFDGDTPAAWAFSAAVSGGEIDIGVETAESYRRMGLASAAARGMLRYVLSEGKRPVWACHAGNAGSRKVAEGLGFTVTGECFTVRKDG